MNTSHNMVDHTTSCDHLSSAYIITFLSTAQKHTVKLMIKVKQKKSFTHPTVRKTFAVIASSVLKVLLLLKAFVGKTFIIHCKT